jgi:isoaspartyl peptidase/L-asparaginase-like protein (Ntn-hydrolase superfamily)
MRSCLSFLVVQYMRAGSPVQKACEQAIAQMKETLAVDASKRCV